MNSCWNAVLKKPRVSSRWCLLLHVLSNTRNRYLSVAQLRMLLYVKKGRGERGDVKIYRRTTRKSHYPSNVDVKNVRYPVLYACLILFNKNIIFYCKVSDFLGFWVNLFRTPSSITVRHLYTSRRFFFFWCILTSLHFIPFGFNIVGF